MDPNSWLFRYLAGYCRETCVYGPERAACQCVKGQCTASSMKGFREALLWPRRPQPAPAITEIVYFHKKRY